MLNQNNRGNFGSVLSDTLEQSSVKKSQWSKTAFQHKKNIEKFNSDNLGDDEFDVKIEGVSDPCTEAALFWGDQALSEDDVQDCLTFSHYFQAPGVL